MVTPRILFLLHGSIFERYGGVEYYLDDVISMAGKIYGLENIRVVAPLEGEQKCERDYHVTFEPRPTNKWLRKLFNRAPLPLLRAADREIQEFRPDLIINSHVSLGAGARWLANRYQLPLATVVYGIDCWGGLLPHDEWALRRSDKIISISEWTKRILVERGYRAEQIEIVHPRLPDYLDTIAPNPEREANPFKLLTVSRLDASEQYKGHDHVIRSLAKLKKQFPKESYHYVILGDGNDKARLVELAKSSGVLDWVEFRSALKDRAELIKAYRETDCFIMPSQFGKWKGRWRGEGFGIVYVEAGAFGVPSIAYDCGGATNIIVHQKTGLLLEPDNEMALTESIRQLRNDRPLTRRMGLAAREHVLKTFCGPEFRRAIENSVDRLFDVTHFSIQTTASSQSHSHSKTHAR